MLPIRPVVQLRDFSHPILKEALAFRGGTALYNLHLPAARYSEDIDLVQVRAEPAGPVMEALREALDPWLGAQRGKQTEGRVTFVYRFESEDLPPIALRLKVEINSREHFSVYGIKTSGLAVDSRWFRGSCDILSYALDELMGTKLRALYQRKQGRDLFDRAIALKDDGSEPARIIEAFEAYMEHGGHRVSRAQFEENMAGKMRDPQFRADIGPLLSSGFEWDVDEAARLVGSQLSSACRAILGRTPTDCGRLVLIFCEYDERYERCSRPIDR